MDDLDHESKLCFLGRTLRPAPCSYCNSSYVAPTFSESSRSRADIAAWSWYLPASFHPLVSSPSLLDQMQHGWLGTWSIKYSSCVWWRYSRFQWQVVVWLWKELGHFKCPLGRALGYLFSSKPSLEQGSSESDH